MRKRAGTLTWMAAGLLASSLCVCPAFAQDASPIRDQDRSIFDTLYGEKLTSVKRTRASADDMTLADEMFDFAEGLTGNDTGVRCLIFAELISLASNAADLKLMDEAWEQLEATWPKQDLVSLEQLMQLSSRAYRGVDRSDREDQGEQYIELLIDIAKRYETAGDPEQAIGVSRLASTIARTIESEQLDRIEDKLKRLAAANDIAKRIAILKLSVKKNPQNSPAARELVNLLITKYSDVNAAAEYVESTRDEELIDLVNRCAAGVEAANAATAMRVGDWHISLAEDASDEQSLVLLHVSRKWYEQFFSLYQRDDALAKRATQMDNLALLKIERLIATNPELAAKAIDGWLPLMAPPFDAKAQQRGNADVFEVNNNELTADGSALVIPFNKARSYEARLTLTVHDDNGEGQPAIFIYLPVGKNRHILTRFHATGDPLVRVDKIREERVLRDLPDRKDKKVTLTFQVAELNGQVAYAMLYDGEVAVKWQGELDELNEYDENEREKVPEDGRQMILLRFAQKLTLHAVDYKERG
ncbi:MAG: hypothetical protein AB8C95_16215 [Phycisphaeraceae bacterium]